ncbi:hypothetical protein [Mycoplasmopsis alligatoris]|uniref:hypothetical protein n=1 Tax=Mycoplasmopsis alligatoris TaxID=47687 RepID=UPI00058C19F6|nr:hypothetical protein [Mycoplasmopsis alligatoris]
MQKQIKPSDSLTIATILKFITTLFVITYMIWFLVKFYPSDEASKLFYTYAGIIVTDFVTVIKEMFNSKEFMPLVICHFLINLLCNIALFFSYKNENVNYSRNNCVLIVIAMFAPFVGLIALIFLFNLIKRDHTEPNPFIYVQRDITEEENHRIKKMKKKELKK